MGKRPKSRATGLTLLVISALSAGRVKLPCPADNAAVWLSTPYSREITKQMTP